MTTTARTTTKALPPIQLIQRSDTCRWFERRDQPVAGRVFGSFSYYCAPSHATLWYLVEHQRRGRYHFYTHCCDPWTRLPIWASTWETLPLKLNNYLADEAAAAEMRAKVQRIF